MYYNSDSRGTNSDSKYIRINYLKGTWSALRFRKDCDGKRQKNRNITQRFFRATFARNTFRKKSFFEHVTLTIKAMLGGEAKTSYDEQEITKYELARALSGLSTSQNSDDPDSFHRLCLKNMGPVVKKFASGRRLPPAMATDIK